MKLKISTIGDVAHRDVVAAVGWVSSSELYSAGYVHRSQQAAASLTVPVMTTLCTSGARRLRMSRRSDWLTASAS